jgi:hypothetical protein
MHFVALSLILLLALQAKAAPAANLKTVELAGKYTIRVPANFAAKRVAASSVPEIAFVRDVNNRATYFDVTVEQLPGNASFRAKPGTHHFTISRDREVSYGWDIVDNTRECTMNSPCPVPVQARIRYTILYKFTFFDEPTNTVVRFSGSQRSPSKNVTGFEGVGKLLRDVIVPSLTPIQ